MENERGVSTKCMTYRNLQKDKIFICKYEQKYVLEDLNTQFIYYTDIHECAVDIVDVFSFNITDPTNQLLHSPSLSLC